MARFCSWMLASTMVLALLACGGGGGGGLAAAPGAGAVWIQRTTDFLWGDRYDHDALVPGNRMYVFGGREQGTNALLTDVWATPPP